MKTLYYKHVAGRTSGWTLLELLVVVLIILLAVWTDRNLDFWLSHWKGEPVNSPWWISVLCLLVAPALVFACLVGEIARMAV